jgi:hypothetical protein
LQEKENQISSVFAFAADKVVRSGKAAKTCLSVPVGSFNGRAKYLSRSARKRPGTGSPRVECLLSILRNRQHQLLLGLRLDALPVLT